MLISTFLKISKISSSDLAFFDFANLLGKGTLTLDLTKSLGLVDVPLRSSAGETRTSLAGIGSSPLI